VLKPRLHPPVTAVTPYLFSGAFADARWRGHAVAKVRIVRAHVNYLGLSGRIISSAISRFATCFAIDSIRWELFEFFDIEWLHLCAVFYILRHRYEHYIANALVLFAGLVYIVGVNNKSTCEICNNRLIRNINSGLLIMKWLSIKINMVIHIVYNEWLYIQWKHTKPQCNTIGQQFL